MRCHACARRANGARPIRRACTLAALPLLALALGAVPAAAQDPTASLPLAPESLAGAGACAGATAAVAAAPRPRSGPRCAA